MPGKFNLKVYVSLKSLHWLYNRIIRVEPSECYYYDHVAKILEVGVLFSKDGWNRLICHGP